MPSNTLTPLATYTVTGSSTTSVTFGSFSGYTDLRVVINGGSDFSAGFPYLYVNNDSTTAYSGIAFIGNGSSAFKEANTNSGKCGNFSSAFTTSLSGTYIIDFMNYSNTNMNKTMLWRMGSADNTSGYSGTGYAATHWRGSKAAITSLDFRLTNSGTDRVWKAGTTFNLYGIKSAAASTISILGGTLYSDATYNYRVFTSTENLIIEGSDLTADILLVAGGGGGGSNQGGGGGAGGMYELTSQKLIAGTHLVSIGAGGVGSSINSPNNGTNGGNTTVGNFIPAIGGGRGGTYSVAAGSGGSGGGESGGGTGLGSGTSGQGNAGGDAGYYGAGGGGKGAAGTNTPASNNAIPGAGAGGVGATSSISGGSVTGFGQLSSGSYYFAGGGGGGSTGSYSSGAPGAGGIGGGGAGQAQNYNSPAVVGTANTGGGGGGGNQGGEGYASLGKNGGSGIVIVRYAR